MNKIDFKSLIIGFLLSSCIFLFMGATIEQRYGDVLKVELVGGSIPALDVNIKDFPSYERLNVLIHD